MRQKKAKEVLSDEPIMIGDQSLQQFVGYHIKLASNAVLNHLAKTLKPFELRMITYTALSLIIDNPGLRQSQLADAMDVERPNLVVIVDELEKRELITRDKVPSDRRAYALHATHAGHHLYGRAIKAVQKHEERLRHEIDPLDVKNAIATLGRIQKNAEGGTA